MTLLTGAVKRTIPISLNDHPEGGKNLGPAVATTRQAKELAITRMGQREVLFAQIYGTSFDEDLSIEANCRQADVAISVSVLMNTKHETMTFVLEDEGSVAANSRLRRKDRWSLDLPVSEPQAFIKKLAELQVLLAVPQGDRMVVVDFGKDKPQAIPISKAELTKLNRLWWTYSDRMLCAQIARDLALEKVPERFAVFIPQSLEDAVRDHEARLYNKTEAQLDKANARTMFRVSRTKAEWQITVPQ